MNPFKEHFKEIIGRGATNGENIGNVYKSVLYQRGFGFDHEVNHHDTYGLGFSEGLQGFFKLMSPILSSGLKFLGNQAVNTAANIAHDVIAGENAKDSAKTHVKKAAEQIFARAPEAISQVIRRAGSKRKFVSRQVADGEVTVSRTAKRFKGNRRIGRGLLSTYPALEKIL